MARPTHLSTPSRSIATRSASKAGCVLRARHVLLSLLLLCCAQAACAASWQTAPEVVYVEADSPFTEQQVEAAIRYAVAAWSARIQLSMHYADTPTEAGYQQGRIVIRWLDTLEMVQTSSNILSLAATRRWVYASTDGIAGAEIYLHRESFRQRGADACFTHAVLHEMGHALGISHLAAPHAVMYASLGACQHTLTTEDIAAAPYPQHICHAELLSNHDLYLPVININRQSWSARLRHDQGVWSVAEYRKVAWRPECADTWLEAGDLILNKVWTPDHIWHGELVTAGSGQWKLRFARR